MGRERPKSDRRLEVPGGHSCRRGYDLNDGGAGLAAWNSLTTEEEQWR